MADLIVRRAARVFGYDLEGPLAIVITAGRVVAVMAERDLGAAAPAEDGPELDAAGRAVIPGFVDAHTHLVFAGSRHLEFAARLEGRVYEAGGIMQTGGA